MTLGRIPIIARSSAIVEGQRDVLC